MRSVIFTAGLQNAMRGQINFETDRFGVILVGAAYQPDRQAHEFRSSVAGEIEATGYKAGGLQATVKMTRVGNVVTIDLGGAVLKKATINARGAVYFKRRGDAALEELVAFIDFGRDVISTEGDFTIFPSSIVMKN